MVNFARERFGENIKNSLFLLPYYYAGVKGKHGGVWQWNQP